MTRTFSVAAVVALLGLGFAAPVHAAPIASFATIQVGLQTTNLILTPDATKAGRFFFDGTLTGADFDVSVNGTLDPDPSILFSLNVQNLGTSPLSVSLSAAVLFSPIVTQPTASSSIRGNLQPGVGAPAGVTITPLFSDMDGDGIPEMLVTSAGDPSTNLHVDVGPSASFAAAGTNAYGPFSAGPVLGPTGLSFLQANLSFALTGGGDVADLQGSSQLQVTAVPEPATVALLGTGLLLVASRWGRKRGLR